MTRLFELAKIPHSTLLKSLHAAGLDAISLKNWSILQSTAGCMDQPGFAIKKVHEQITDLKQSLSQIPDRDFKADVYRDMLCWARLTQPTYRKWQQQQIAFFNDPLWWHSCFEKIQRFPLLKRQHAEAALHALQYQWGLHSAYAHFSTLDVIHVYQSVISVFAEWLSYARTELDMRRSALSSELLAFYQNYLTWFERALAQEKATLRTCLQGRLAIGLKKGHGVRDNVIAMMRDELKAIGIMPANPKLDSALAYGHLTPQAFVTIRQIIEREGSEEEKTTFYQLGYHRHCQFDQPALFCQHYRLDVQGHTFYIHSSGSDFMPIVQTSFYLKWPRFLHWLFWDDVVRDTFFKYPDCQFLLAQEAAFLAEATDGAKIALANLGDYPAWQQNHLCLTLLLTERERVAQWLKHPMAFFFPTAVQLLSHYQQSLQQSAENWMTKQIKLLNEVMKTQQKKNKRLSLEEKTALKKAMECLQAMQKQWPFSREIRDKVTEVTDQYQALFQLDHTSVVLPPISLRDQFREAILEAIKLFEVVQTTVDLDPSILTLKNQLNVDSAQYDSVVLRSQLTHALKQTPGLPTELKKSLQNILNQSEFSEAKLEREEHSTLRHLLKQTRLLVKEQIDIPTTPIFTVWDQDAWDYTVPAFSQHCKDLEVMLSKKRGEVNDIIENKKLCHYTLQFLKHIVALPNWEAYVARRGQVTPLLTLLIEASVQWFPVLQSSLLAIEKDEHRLNENRWNSFKENTLALRIHILEGFLKIPRSTISIQSDSTSPVHKGDFFAKTKEEFSPTPFASLVTVPLKTF